MQFFAAARGSAAEVLSHDYVALDQDFNAKEDFDRLVAQTTEVGRMLAALMTYLRRSGTKGLKFKVV
jgi:four helix bundle protein